jgi:Protein of unknown function (DUF3667)
LSDGHALGATCRNCDSNLALPANFCPACGQDTLNHPPAFWEFVHEFITHYVALEGKLWKTLWLLFLKPAELTREYRAGRKLRYISPLRLYITASFIFFLAVKVAGLGSFRADENIETGKPQVAEKVSLEKKEPEMEDDPPGWLTGRWTWTEGMNDKAEVSVPCVPDQATCIWFKKRLEKKFAGRTNRQVLEDLNSGMIANVPYALFLMLPLFALLTKLIYINRKFYYGEHVVYALHIHAFTFLGLLLVALLPKVIGDWVAIAMAIYYFIAMKRFFGGRWWATLFRYAIVGTFYPFLLGITTLVVFLAVILI